MIRGQNTPCFTFVLSQLSDLIVHAFVSTTFNFGPSVVILSERKRESIIPTPADLIDQWVYPSDGGPASSVSLGHPMIVGCISGTCLVS